MKKTLLALLLSAAILPAAHATIHTVSVANFSFTPSAVTGVVTGDTMRWMWANGSHTTTSTTIPSGATGWDSPMNSGSTSFDYVPTIAGTYNYVCSFHANMVASFTVTGGTPSCPPFTASTMPTGSVITCTGSPATTFQANSGGAANPAYLWMQGGAPAQGANTGATYTPAVSGTYSVVITDSCGTSHTSGDITYSLVPTPTANFSFSHSGLLYNFTNMSTGSPLTYSWDFGDGGSSASVSPGHMYTADGSYNVTLIVTITGSPCADTMTQSINTTGIAGVHGVEVSMMPNPATGVLSIKMDAAIEKLTVSDLAGRVVASLPVAGAGKGIYTTDVAAIPSGLYLLQITTKEGPLCTKLRVQH